VGETVKPDSFSKDSGVCSNGIHAFVSPELAKQFLKEIL
jgi:hypothetical protein